VTDRSMIWNSDLVETLEWENLIAQAWSPSRARSPAPKAAGAHAREDYPDRDDETWLKHTLAWADCDKRKVTIGSRPVHSYTLSNEIEYIKPKARVYCAGLALAWSRSHFRRTRKSPRARRGRSPRASG
jgi:succinate dehydrogenase / fumarate reductase, flavoprotein subunit